MTHKKYQSLFISHLKLHTIIHIYTCVYIHMHIHTQMCIYKSDTGFPKASWTQQLENCICAWGRHIFRYQMTCTLTLSLSLS